jgi:8-oxo-dGTP diphosphatase
MYAAGRPTACGGEKSMDGSQHVAVAPNGRHGVVAVTRRDERFLVIRRGPTLVAGGRLCFPGGHVEPGEAEHEAVVRECREELAANVEAVECVWRSVTNWGTSLAWWTVTLRGENELVPHPVEVSEILWLSAREMLDHPDVLEGNRPFLEAVMAGRIPV